MSEQEQACRDRLKTFSCWVVKIGSSLITRSGQGLDEALIDSWSEQIAGLRENGIRVVLVSSGSVASGLRCLNWPSRPKDQVTLQALAAIGQPHLVYAWRTALLRHKMDAALALLTHEDFRHRGRYLNIRATLEKLLNMGIVPILNENDTVSTEEMRFGDNDVLASLTANLIGAQALVVLTDRAGLYDKNPAHYPDAQLLHFGTAGDANLAKGAESGGDLGLGGMITKLKAAKYAGRSGCVTVIADGREGGVLQRLRDGERVGTILVPSTQKITARKRWIMGQQHPKGKIYLDDGAVKALIERGKSLLVAGVVQVEGCFASGDIVACVDADSKVVAYGISNLASQEADEIKGMSRQQIQATHGDKISSELIHRDNLAIEDTVNPNLATPDDKVD